MKTLHLSIMMIFSTFIVLTSFHQVFAQNNNDTKILLPSGGISMAIALNGNEFYPGDTIKIHGYAPPNSQVYAGLVNPHNVIITSSHTTNDTSPVNFIVGGWSPSQYIKMILAGYYDITPPCKEDNKIICSDAPIRENVVTQDDEVDVKVIDKGQFAGGFYSKDKVSPKLGFYQATMKFSNTPEVRYSFFLYDPTTQNEIDIIEADTSHCWLWPWSTCITLSSTIHQGYYNTKTNEQDHRELWTYSNYYYPWEFNAAQFHTYALKWKNNNLEFQIDGKKYYNSDYDVNLNDAVIKDTTNFSNMYLYVNSYAFKPLQQRPTDDSLLQVTSITKN